MTSTTMIPVKSVTLGGFGLKFEVRGVPPQFVNAIRRILLNETPTVEISDVQILDNTTLMPHELMRHRMEMLPVAVRPTDEDVVRNANITLRYPVVDDVQVVTTNDFAVSGSRTDIMMKDRDLKTPMYFMRLKKGETVHLTARLTVNPKSSQVCLASYAAHVDQVKADLVKEEHTDKATFDVFHRQRILHLNEKGRPDWFDFQIESLGVIPAKELLVNSLEILKAKVAAWVKLGKENIIRESEPNVYRVVSVVEGHTLGALAQIVAYDSDLCAYVSYDVPHPLRPEMVFRFATTRTPESILDMVGTAILGLCDSTISSVDK
jgi:DNA-directed RNA polymerase alpha subunit